MQTSRYFSLPCFMALVTPKPSPVKLLRLVLSFIHSFIGLLVVGSFIGSLVDSILSRNLL